MTGRQNPFHPRRRPTQSRSRLHLAQTSVPFHVKRRSECLHLQQRSDRLQPRRATDTFQVKRRSECLHLEQRSDRLQPRRGTDPFHMKPRPAPCLVPFRERQMLVPFQMRQRSDRLQPGPAPDRFQLTRASILFHVKQATSRSPSSHRSGTSWPHPCPSRERRRPWPKPSRQMPAAESP
jgi:hypothetical protein